MQFLRCRAAPSLPYIPAIMQFLRCAARPLIPVIMQFLR
jgi:hypothetical protein